jgi:hypothetical protein
VAAAAGLGLVGPLAAPPAAAITVTVTSHFVWTPPDSDVNNIDVLVVNGATDNRPGAVLFVTPNYNANAVCGCLYDQDPLSVEWDGAGRVWAIVNEDRDKMFDGESFNILVVPKTSKSVFFVTAKSSTVSGNSVFIDSKLTNGKPDAEIMVTQNQTQVPGVEFFNPHQVGVRYNSGKKRWAIFNEDGAPMPVGASFNVMVGQRPSNGGKGEILTATSKSLVNGAVDISSSQTTGNPNNVTFVTQNFSPDGKTGHENNAAPGVWYNGKTEVIFDEDQGSIVAKCAFNALIFSS